MPPDIPRKTSDSAFWLLLFSLFFFVPGVKADESLVFLEVPSGLEELRRAEAFCPSGRPVRVEMERTLEKHPAIGAEHRPDLAKVPANLRESVEEGAEKINQGFIVSSRSIVHSDGKNFFIQIRQNSVTTPETFTTDRFWHFDGKSTVEHMDNNNASVATGLNFQAFPEGRRTLALVSRVPFHPCPEVEIFGGRLSDFVGNSMKKVVITKTPDGFVVEGERKNDEGLAIRMTMVSEPCLRLVKLTRTRAGRYREEWKFTPAERNEVLPFQRIGIHFYKYNKSLNQYALFMEEQVRYFFGRDDDDESFVPRPILPAGKHVIDLDTGIPHTVAPTGRLAPKQAPGFAGPHLGIVTIP